MRTLFKWLALLLLLLLLLLAGGAAYLALFFDPNDYKDRIVAMVRDATGRELTIEGDIQLSYFPWLGLKVGSLELADAPGFGPEPIARIAAADLAVRLLPLFERRVETAAITLRGLRLNLERNADGRGNWEDLASQGAPEAEPVAAAPNGSTPLAALSVGGINLQDAMLNYRDRVSGTQMTLREVNLKTGAIGPEQPFPVDLKLELAATQPEWQGPISLKGQVQPDPAGGRYGLENMELLARLKGAGLAEAAEVKVEADAWYDPIQGNLRLEGLRVGGLGVTINGIAAVTALNADPVVSGSLVLDPFNPRELLIALGQPLVTADPQVLARAEGEFTFVAGGRSADITGLKLKLDDASLGGQVQIRDYAAPALAFELAVDALDLDAYLPPSPQPAAPATPGEAAAGAAGQLPLDSLRRLVLDGSIQIGALTVNRLRLQDVNIQVQGADGLLRLEPIIAGLYDGRYKGAASLDVRGQTPQTQLSWTLTGIQVGPLLEDLTGEDRLLGRGDVQAELAANGVDPERLLGSLNGSLRFTFKDGAVRGINIPYQLRKARAALEGRPPPPEATDRTDFSELSASLRITDGIARNDDLQGKSPLLRVGGEGQADLAGQTLDYTLNTVLVGTLEGQGGQGLDDLQGLAIPVRLQGAFQDPKISLDLAALLASRANAELKARVQEKVEDKLKDTLDEDTRERLKEKLPGALRGLFQ